MQAQYEMAIQASWPTATPVEVRPIHKPRMVSIIGVNGWYRAKSQLAKCADPLGRSGERYARHRHCVTVTKSLPGSRERRTGVRLRGGPVLSGGPATRRRRRS
jgi:hypothetical protein